VASILDETAARRTAERVLDPAASAHEARASALVHHESARHSLAVFVARDERCTRVSGDEPREIMARPAAHMFLSRDERRARNTALLSVPDRARGCAR
jgi:hypothetical protein